MIEYFVIFIIGLLIGFMVRIDGLNKGKEEFRICREHDKHMLDCVECTKEKVEEKAKKVKKETIDKIEKIIMSKKLIHGNVLSRNEILEELLKYRGDEK